MDDAPEGIRAKEDSVVPPDPRGKTLPVTTKSPFRENADPTRDLKSSPSTQVVGDARPVASDARMVVSEKKPAGSFWLKTVLLGVLAGVLTIFLLTYDFGSESDSPSTTEGTSSPPAKTTQAPKPKAQKSTEGKSNAPKPDESKSKKSAQATTTLPVEPSGTSATATVDSEPTPAGPAKTEETTQAETAAASPAPKPEIKTVKDAMKAVENGDKDYALEGLLKLRRAQPKNAQIVFLIGDLYFQRVWWGDAIEFYAEAIRLDPAYKRRASIQRDLIIALSSDKTANNATRVLHKSIGTAALPALRKASKRDTNPVIRKRAEAVIKRIQSR